ncbi:T9SS type A sorting domain-containing protein [Flavobacterium agricola]|uniref:T9SS type A sorting domain-containing protein n=1 Tax=Flavobacterium agricola TaxID=2870839 RepID=A0ABY6M070_9FLAO|nr:T9SS type A sorting domain-containing protein [Flavobacterium agricola]UYW00568.1 T9SS type A sorting domain-containing protein [Flavobacterium agricola]
MKKIIFHSFIAFALFQISDMNAQLTVKGNDAFMYVGDETLFVNQEVRLDDGKIYLRRNAKLLQGNNGAKVDNNVGTPSGALSAFVMSKPTDHFNYSHYGLPVSTNEVSGANKSNVFKFNTTSVGGVVDVRTHKPIDFSGVPYSKDGEAGNGGSIRLVPNYIAWMDGAGQYSSWRYPLRRPASDNAIPKGVGLYMKGTSGTDDTKAHGELNDNKAGNKLPQRFDFRGIPNDGEIKVVVDQPGVLFMLGNPYPSDFNLNKFIKDNDAVIEGVYFYAELNKNSHHLDQYNYGYIKYVPTPTPGDPEAPEGTRGNLVAPTSFYKVGNQGVFVSEAESPQDGANQPVVSNDVPSFLPLGTGFWVRAKEGVLPGTTVVFNNSHRLAVSDQSELMTTALGAAGAARSNSEVTEYGNYSNIINTNGVDYTKVSKAPAPMFSIVANQENEIKALGFVFNDLNDENLLRMSRTEVTPTEGNFNLYVEKYDKNFNFLTDKFDVNERIPLTVDNPKEGSVYFQLDNLVNFKLADNIYIYDDYTGEYKDVKSERVSFNVPAGVNKGRYFITFNRDNKNGIDDVVNNNSFVVLQNNKERALTISNPEALNLTSAEMFDIRGRLVLAKKNLGSEPEYRFSTSGLADGIYIVKIATATGKPVSKKVIVKN